MNGLGQWSRRVVTLVVAVVALLVSAGSAWAQPVWEVDAHHGPGNFQPGATAEYTFLVNNVGDAPTSGPVEMEVRLPPGVTTRFQKRYFFDETWFAGWGALSPAGWDCGAQVEGESSLSCTSVIDPVQPGALGLGALKVYVAIDPAATGPLTAQVTVRGGGADTVTINETAQLGPAATVFGIAPGTFKADAYDRQGRPELRAGVHPFRATVGFDFNMASVPKPNPFLPDEMVQSLVPIDNVRDLNVKLPRGFIGNPQAVSQCRQFEFAVTPVRCPSASQIGTAQVLVRYALGNGGAPAFIVTPVFNMAPPEGVAAVFGLIIDGRPTLISAGLDPKDYSVVTTVPTIVETLSVHFQKLTLWGDPGDPVHDTERWNPEIGYGGGWGAKFGGKRVPFLTLPSECDVPGTTKMKATSWRGAADPVAAKADAGARLETDPVRLHSCENQRFGGSLDAKPETKQVGTPTGLGVNLNLEEDPSSTYGTPPLRTAVVKLPEGVSVSPASATGLGGCASSEIKLKTNDPITCPDASKIGTVSITTPVLPDPLEGSVYLASPHDNPFRSLLATYLVVRGPGVLVKLPGKVEADTVTGQLTARFDENPQLPFSKLNLVLKGGARAPLATGGVCGTFMTHTELTPWSSNTAVVSDSPMVLDEGCDPGPFRPSLNAGTVNPVAGARTPFTLSVGNSQPIRRPIGRIDTVLPPGLLGQIKSVSQCPEDRAAAGTCDVSSQVGTTTLKLGAGDRPFSLPAAGKTPTAVYLAGPYKGAPFSLSIVVPAQAGPFDLGTVVVRAGLYVDPITAQVTVKSDPLPTILDGIPTTLAGANVNVDRPGFIFNPTGCNAKAVDATITPVTGPTGAPAIDASGLGVPTAFGDPVAVSSRFQVGNCKNLDLKPSLALSLSGKGQTTDGKHPAVTANLIQKAGQSNLKKVTVKLPLSVALDPDNSQSDGLCSFVEGSKPDPKCPKSSVVGSATAITPILDQPLSGPVYFVKNERKDPKSGRSIKTLPKIVIPLTGQNGIKLTLTGTSDVIGQRLVTTFNNIPDAPVSSFKLNINGGKKGILVISGDKADICKSTQIADQQIDGQNGKTADADISIQTPSCPLKVLSKKVGKTSVAIKVGGLGAGKVTIIGKGIKKTTKTIAKSTVATIVAKRTKGRPGKVTVSYDPAGPAKAKKTSK